MTGLSAGSFPPPLVTCCSHMSHRWYNVENTNDVLSPALLVYVGRVEENIRRMITIAGDVARLRPHIKTHKMPEVLRMQLKQGITKFKCATIAEAEMAATAGAKDILLAYQPVGPNIDRLLILAGDFPAARFSCVADNANSIRDLSAAAERYNAQKRTREGVKSVFEFSDAAVRACAPIEILLDLNIGQNRTGVVPTDDAFLLYKLLATLPTFRAGGLHAYDGHLSQTDLGERTAACEAAFAPVGALRRKLEREGLPVPRVVTSGTPTFPMHARRGDVECSPGTCVFWDAGYARKLPDLDFLPAAVLLTRVVSKPTANRLCLDLGHKAVASEMAHPRVVFLNLDDATPVVHSEEHLVVETPHAEKFAIGDCIYGIPWHVCPTVALHSEAVVVRDGRAGERWKVTARDRSLTI